MKRTPTPRPSADFIRRQRARLLARDGDRCNWCRETFTEDNPATLDHLVPLSYGGARIDENAVLACAACNARRGHYIRCTSCDGRVRSFATALIVDRRDFHHEHCADRLKNDLNRDKSHAVAGFLSSLAG